jgi:2-iminoacetate synthase ThiH
MIKSYRNHMKVVYEMEMFYGDETLKHLMDHTRSLHEVLDEFEDIYEIAVPPQEDEETDNNKEETEEDATKTIDKENVFYGGTRTSNN